MTTNNASLQINATHGSSSVARNIESNQPIKRVSSFESKQEYEQFQHTWNSLATERRIGPMHVAVRSLLLGRPLGSAFSPITNPVKLSNGLDAWGVALRCARAISHARIPSEFEFLSDVTAARLRVLASSVSADLLSSKKCVEA